MPFSQPLNTLRIDLVHPLQVSAAATNNASGAFTAVSDPNLRCILDSRGYSGVRLLARLGGTVHTSTAVRVQRHLSGNIDVASGDAGWATLGDSPGSHTVGQWYISPIITLPANHQINGLVLRAGIFSGNSTADPTITGCTLAFYKDASQSIEDAYLVFQSLQNYQGLRKDMRRNAQQYKADLVSARLTVPQCAAAMNADAGAYLTRIAWQEAHEASSKLANGLAAMGSAMADLIAIRSELKTAAENLQAASKTTQAEIDSASDALLAAVAANDFVF